jgi:hypothetical protein
MRASHPATGSSALQQPGVQQLRKSKPVLEASQIQASKPGARLPLLEISGFLPISTSRPKVISLTATCNPAPGKASGLDCPQIGGCAYPSQQDQKRSRNTAGPAPGSGPRSLEGDACNLREVGGEGFEGRAPSSRPPPGAGRSLSSMEEGRRATLQIPRQGREGAKVGSAKLTLGRRKLTATHLNRRRVVVS